MSELPRGWASAALAEIAEVRLGRQRSPKNHSGSRMRPYLRAANVTWNGLDLTDVKEMNFTETESATYELRPGDVVVAEASGSASEVGKAAIWRGEIDTCCFQNTLIRVRSTVASSEYLRYFLLFEARSGRIGNAAPGVGIHHIGAGRLSDWLTPLPPLNEQRRIVAAIEEHLSRLDAADASLAIARRRLDVSRTQFIEDAMRGVWPSTTLGQIAEIAGGVTKDAKRQADPAFVEVPYLRVANVQRGYLDLREVTTIRVPAQKAAALRLEVGDVLFNEGGDRDKLGRGWVWSGEIDNCIHQNHVFRARLNGDFDPKFVSWHGNTFGRTWFEAHGRQTTNLASLNLTTLKSFPVPVPPLEEQRRIVAEVEARLSALDALRASIERAERRSRALRAAVLARALSGRARPAGPVRRAGERPPRPHPRHAHGQKNGHTKG